MSFTDPVLAEAGTPPLATLAESVSPRSSTLQTPSPILSPERDTNPSTPLILELLASYDDASNSPRSSPVPQMPNAVDSVRIPSSTVPPCATSHSQENRTQEIQPNANLSHAGPRSPNDPTRHSSPVPRSITPLITPRPSQPSTTTGTNCTYVETKRTGFIIPENLNPRQEIKIRRKNDLVEIKAKCNVLLATGCAERTPVDIFVTRVNAYKKLPICTPDSQNKAPIFLLSQGPISTSTDSHGHVHVITKTGRDGNVMLNFSNSSMHYPPLPGPSTIPEASRVWELTVRPLEGTFLTETRERIKVLAKIRQSNATPSKPRQGRPCKKNPPGVSISQLLFKFRQLPASYQVHHLSLIDITLQTIKGTAILGEIDPATNTISIQVQKPRSFLPSNGRPENGTDTESSEEIPLHVEIEDFLQGNK